MSESGGPDGGGSRRTPSSGLLRMVPVATSFGAVLRRTFLSHAVLGSFAGMISLFYLSAWLFDRTGTRWEVTLLSIPVAATLNGLAVCLLAWTLLLLRRLTGAWLIPGVKGLDKFIAVTLVGFLCGALDVLFFLVSWGVICLTVITTILVVLHIRDFLRRAVKMLEPGKYPEWGDVGELVFVFLTMLAAFSLINATMGILYQYADGRAAAFASNVPITSLADYFYFSIVVMTTLGFGDIYPVTVGAKLIVAFQCLTSYVMFALMIGIITRGILPRRREED